MTPPNLGYSSALGFYSKHCQLLDDLCISESDYLPSDPELDEHFGKSPLVEVVKANRTKLERILEGAETDADGVDKWLRQALVVKLGAVGLVTNKGRCNWGCHIWVQHPDRRRRRLPKLQLGWNWESEVSGLKVCAWLWTKGGSIAIGRLGTFVQKHGIIQRQTALSNGGSSATVVLAHIPVDGDGEFRVDLDALANAILDAFKWLTARRLDWLLHELAAV